MTHFFSKPVYSAFLSRAENSLFVLWFGAFNLSCIVRDSLSPQTCVLAPAPLARSSSIIGASNKVQRNSTKLRLSWQSLQPCLSFQMLNFPAIMINQQSLSKAQTVVGKCLSHRFSAYHHSLQDHHSILSCGTVRPDPFYLAVRWFNVYTDQSIVQPQ